MIKLTDPDQYALLCSLYRQYSPCPKVCAHTADAHPLTSDAQPLQAQVPVDHLGEASDLRGLQI